MSIKKPLEYIRGKEFFNKVRDYFIRKAYQNRKLIKQDQPFKRYIRDRVIDSLNHIGQHELSNKIKNCKKTNRCQSIYCSMCMENIHKSSRKKLQHHIDILNLNEVKPKNEDFLHISGVLGLSEVNTDSVEALITKDRANLKSVHRKLQKLPNYRFVELVYELELVDIQKLKYSNGCPKKKRQIQELIERDLNRDSKKNLYIYVHFHGVTNITRSELKNAFGKRYFIGGKPLYNHDDETGLYVQSFHESNELSKNLDSISSYPIKNALQFKHDFSGADTTYEPFTHEELGSLVYLYQEVQKDNYQGLFRRITND